ncbi:MAG: protein arginine kinase [Eubacteriales bacterium]
MPKWLRDGEFKDDIVLSTRVRLARNVKGLPYPNKMTKQAEVNRLVSIAKKAFVEHSDFEFIDFGNITNIQKWILQEKYLISPQFAKRKYAGLILSPDERLSIMIMEEDHFRLQGMMPGFEVEKTYALVDELDNMLAKTADYSFSQKLGYLTACPTNLGTGMRVSVMLNLPALNMSREIKPIVAGLEERGLTCRGAFGEGTSPLGDLFQISNEVTLGHSEKDILSAVESATREIIELEKKAQHTMYDINTLLVEDRIFRSLATLKSARRLSTKEMTSCISYVNMGISLGLIDEIDHERLYSLIIDTRPATMAEKDGKLLPEVLRDERRAELVRKALM